MKNNIAAGLAVSPHILKRLMERDMGAVMYMVIGSLYAIVVGPTTLKVPQPAMTFADFSIVWFIIGAAIAGFIQFLARSEVNFRK